MIKVQTRQIHLGQALALLAVSQALVVLDGSIVNVALPSIAKGLHFSESNLPWVLNAYVLTFGGLLLLGGRLADLLGRRRVFMFGLVLFALSSLAGGLSQGAGQLIAARALQGVGAAMLSSAALSLLTSIFKEGPERNRALGVWGAAAGSSGAIGVLLGGVLTSAFGWQWILFVNVPIGLIAAAVTPRLLPESRAAGSHQGFDPAGAISVTAGLTVLVYALVSARSSGLGLTVGLLVVAFVLLATFVLIELRNRTPLVPFRIFRVASIASAKLVGLFVGASLLPMFFFISLYMQQVLAYGPLQTGLGYLPLAFTITVVAAVASSLVTHFGFKAVSVGGLALVVVGLAWFARVSVNGSYAGDVLLPSLVAAVGLGLTFVSITVAAMGGVPAGDTGLASGLLNTSQQIGGALGLAILSALATAQTANEAAPPTALSLTDGFQVAFEGGAVLAAIGLALALVFMRRTPTADVAAMKDAA